MSAQKVENLNLLPDRQYQLFQMFDLKARLNRSVKTKTFQTHSFKGTILLPIRVNPTKVK